MKLLVKNPKKTGFLAKIAFFDTFWPKNPQFWIFLQVPLLTHASRHLGEDFRKFSAKTNDKNWSYKSKTFKKLDFCQKLPFFDSFWPKMANFWIFSINPLGTFFYIPKALSNCQVSEKNNERMSRYERDARTYIRTNIQGSTYRSTCGETKKYFRKFSTIMALWRHLDLQKSTFWAFWAIFLQIFACLTTITSKLS